MDFRRPPAEEEYQREFDSRLDANLPEEWDVSGYRVYHSAEEWADPHRGFQRRLFDAGYAGLHYPRAYGGQGKTLAEELIVSEACAAKCMELKIPGIITFGMAGPTILLCGTEDQKKEFLPKIMDGTHIWC